jgi:hypothetical protein
VGQSNNSINVPVTMIGSHRVRALTWIPQYVFNYPVIFRDIDNPFDGFAMSITTKDVMFIADVDLRSRFYHLNMVIILRTGERDLL